MNNLAASTIRIRAFSRLGLLSEAVSEVEAGSSLLQKSDSNDERALFCGWSARVMDRVGDRLRGEFFIAAARGYALCSPDPDVWAQINFLSALVLTSRDSKVQVDDLLAPALTSKSPRIRAQALELKAALAGRVGNRDLQAFLGEEAWKAIALDAADDQHLAANSLFNTALLAIERCDQVVQSKISQRMTAINWHDGLALQRFEVSRFAAWSRALSGDHLGAFALWRESASIAPSSAWRVLALVDRALLAQEMGEQLFAREELAHARAIGETVDWENTTDQERLILLPLAQSTAFSDPVGAAKLLERYRSAKPSMPLHTQLSTDPLIQAPEDYTAGVIAMATGELTNADGLLNSAFALWRDAGYSWRASQAAVRLLEIGAANAEQRAYLAKHAPLFPNSWIAARARVLLNEPAETKDGPSCKAV